MDFFPNVIDFWTKIFDYYRCMENFQDTFIIFIILKDIVEYILELLRKVLRKIIMSEDDSNKVSISNNKENNNKEILIGDYIIKKTLGTGTFSVVKLVIHRITQKKSSSKNFGQK